MSHNIRHVHGSDQTSVQIFVNMKVCGQFLMLIVIIVEYRVVVECNCNNIISLATRCGCKNPACVNDSTSTKVELLVLIFKKYVLRT